MVRVSINNMPSHLLRNTVFKLKHTRKAITRFKNETELNLGNARRQEFGLLGANLKGVFAVNGREK